MKNIVLIISTLTVLQMSTCGNQSYSKRGSSVIETLYKQYLDANENIESLNEQYNDVLQDNSETLQDWNSYNRFSKSYWQEAKTYISSYDTSLQKSLGEYFDQQEKRYVSNTKAIANEANKIQELTAEMRHNMSMLKLLASHKQMEEYLTKNKPEIKPIQDYNKSLELTNTLIDKATKDLGQGKLNTKSLE